MIDSAISLLAQSEKITNWLTPVWILSLGVALGFVLVLFLLLKIYVGSKIPGINTVAEKPTARIVLGVLLALVYTGLFLAFYYWRYGIADTDGSGAIEIRELGRLVLPLIFVIPLSLLVGIGGLKLFSKRGADEAFSLLREGFLSWASIVCMVMTGFAIVGIVLGIFNGFGIVKFVDDVPGMVNSIKRYPMAGIYTTTFEVEPTAGTQTGQTVPVNLVGDEVSFAVIKSSQLIEIASEPITRELAGDLMLEVDSTSLDKPVAYIRRPGAKSWVADGQIDEMFIANRGNNTANVTIDWRLDPVYHQVWLVPWTAACVLGLFLFYLVLAVNFPKIAAISHSTFKTEVSQPLFWLILVLGVVFVIASVYVPYNTFGEDIKMYKDSGLTLIRVLAIFVAIWAASKSVAEEIEGRTALTVLSKPVGRRQFILGKFSGISLAVGMLFILLGLCFVIWVSYKPIYDAVETSQGTTEWEVCFLESIQIIPALILCFLEVVIFVAISVAISTRIGTLPNFLICFAVYVLGHLTPLIVQSSEVVQAFETVVVFGNVIAIIFPVLNHFDVQAAINTNSPVPMIYLGWSVIYTMLYGSIALLVALVLFEDRDLA